MEDVKRVYNTAKKSIVTFRNIFFPSDDNCEPAWFHYEWDKILREGKTHFAVEAFRESAKSSLVIRAFLLYCLVYPEKKRSFICIVMANQRAASKRLKEIGREFMSNPYLSSNYIETIEDSEKALEMNLYDDDKKVINVRIEAHGKGGLIRGSLHHERRPDLVIIDDPQDTSDATSEAITTADYDWFLSDVYFLGKDSRIFMIGNNLGAKCLIEQVISKKKQLNFEVMIVPIINELGESNWPAKWPIEKIEEEKLQWADMGKYDIWYREKMCISMSPETQLFRKEDFRYYDKLPDGLSVYITVDMAISLRSTADYSVIMTVGVNNKNHWFIIECKYGRWNPTDLMENIFSAVSTHKPIMVGIEKVGYQAALEHFLMKDMPRRNIFFTVKPLMADKKKEIRIQMMQPRFKAGTVWMPEFAEWRGEFETQMFACTPSGSRGLHDDIPDALAYMEQIALPPAGSYDEVQEEDLPLAGGM